MPAYVDPEGSSYGRIGRVHFTAHLIADTPEELHALADKIGLKRAWAQTSNSGLLHYDITAGKRRQAIAAGAEDCGRTEFVRIMRRPT